MLKNRHLATGRSSALPVALAVAACAWLAGVVAAPFQPVSVGVLVYALGSVVCHQLPERSFHLGGVQLAVCARCVGIYAGAAAALVWCAARGTPRGGSSLVSDIWRRRWTLAIGAVPTAVTVLAEVMAGWTFSNATRAGAGVALGGALALVVSEAATLHYEQWPLRPRA